MNKIKLIGNISVPYTEPKEKVEIANYFKKLGIDELIYTGEGSYEEYVEEICPYAILKLEEVEINNKGVFILSAFPEFLLDYFGMKLWKKCAKHTSNLLEDN